MITLASATALEQLALAIFNPPLDAAGNVVWPIPAGSPPVPGINGGDASIDAQYYAQIAPIMLAIDGLVMAPGFKYTLNVTCALEGRARHWYMGLSESNIGNPHVTGPYPAWCGLTLVPDQPTGWTSGANSYGNTIGNATCAAILRSWAAIVRMWLAGNYPWAVAQPPAA